MVYKILLESRAERDLKVLDKKLQEIIVGRLLSLANDPRPINSKKLEGSKTAWRLRIRNWRVIYEIDDKNHEARIYRIKHRSKAY